MISRISKALWNALEVELSICWLDPESEQQRQELVDWICFWLESEQEFNA